MKGAVSSLNYLCIAILSYCSFQMIALWYVPLPRCLKRRHTSVLTVLSFRVLDAVHLSLTSHTIYHYIVLNFMNPLALLACPW